MPQYLTGMRKQNTTLPTTTTPSATMLGGGRGASQAAQVQAINNQNAARQAAQEIAIKNAIANAARAVASPAATPVDTTPTDISINGGSVGGNSGNGGGTYRQSAAVVSDPYADLMAIYQQKLDAENAANEQRRQAQLNALNSRYATAKSKLSDAFNSGESALNNDANKALREAFIQSKLNERTLNQRLQSMGINGGAMESSLARAYNDYGNSRNAIEQNRMDALKDLLSQYQGQLGDMESAYAANLADLDSNYFGNGLDFVTDYYDAIAALQKQNAASNLQAQLGKRSSGSAVANDNGLDSNIVSLVKGFKNNPSSAVRLLNSYGITGDAMTPYLWAGQIDPTLIDDYGNDSTANAPTSGITDGQRQSMINTLRRVMSLSKGTKDGSANVAAQMDQFAKTYGLTQAEAQAILAEAGF